MPNYDYQHPCRFLPGITTIAGLVGVALAAPPMFEPLGDLPGGPIRSLANAVSADGRAVVGFSNSTNGEEAFRWTRDTGMNPLGALGGPEFLSIARGVSGDGSIVVGESIAPDADPNGVVAAFRWTISGGGPGGVLVGLDDLAGGENFATAAACSSDGTVIVGHSSSTASGAGGADAFRKVGASAMASIGDLPGGAYYSIATGLSPDGQYVVGYSSSSASGASNTEAFLWSQADGMLPLGDLPGGSLASNAFGVSADGTVVVGIGEGTGGAFAFRWTQGGGMVSLGDLPGGLNASRASSVSADGSIVVGQSFTAVGFEAFVWTEADGLRNLRQALVTDYGLDLTGWILSVATAITPDGLTVVGYGINPAGQVEAWRAHFGNGCVILGDLDYDDDVDINDLAVLLSNFGETGVSYEDGDIDDNGIVDISDLAVQLANFADVCP